MKVIKQVTKGEVMKAKKLMMTSAMAGLLLAGGTMVSQAADSSSEEVKCYGVNACKGHGDCSGKINACSGDNGCEATLKCQSMNSCKGKGIKKMSKKECMDKKGQVAS